MSDLKIYLVIAASGNAVQCMSEADRDRMFDGTGIETYELEEGASTMAERYVVKDGAVVDLFPGKTDEEVREGIRAAMDVDPDIVANAKRSKIAEVRMFFDAEIRKLKNDVAPYELETWDRQANEYERYQTDPTKPTPWIDGLAMGRGITKEALVELIGRKITGLAYIQGRQHRLEKLIEAAESLSAAQAIKIEL